MTSTRLIASTLKPCARAVELDPQDAEAHANLAFSLAVSGDLDQAEAEFETAERLNPELG